MKFVLTLCAILFGTVAFAGESVSVLNHNAPAPVAVPATVVAAATAPAAAVEVVIVAGPRRTRCANGRCCTGPNCQLFSVNEESHEYVRNRVLGGQVIRRGSRTVVRPVR
jgi:hypothetical protein